MLARQSAAMTMTVKFVYLSLKNNCTSFLQQMLTSFVRNFGTGLIDLDYKTVTPDSSQGGKIKVEN